MIKRMKKLLLIILLLSAFPINANALDWVTIDVSDEGRTYIDVDSIRKVDGYVYVWVLVDLSDVVNSSDGSFLSAKSYDQIDCTIVRSKRLTYLFYQENMGKGDVVTDKGNDEWHYASPDSRFEKVIKIACNYD